MLLPSLFLFSFLFGGEKVVINEFSFDDSSTDDREFVELYNPTSKPIDISGWVLSSNDPFGANTGYTIPPSTTLAAGDYYVMGAATVANVDQVVGTTNLWENGQESLYLVDDEGNIIDSVLYESNKGLYTGSQEEGEGIWGNFTSINGVETSLSRIRDGHDTNNNQDFRLQPHSPGTTNNLAAGGYSDTFDTGSVGDVIAAFGSSFATARLIDPATADTNNPNAIALSPQGGKAAIFWDNSGGGNHNMLLRDASCEFVLEAYVYFDATAEAAGEREVWTFGVGTSGTFFNFPDPSGTAGFTANGNTGIAWTFENTDTNSTLYLVDHNDGGRGTAAKTDRVVLGKIDLTTTTDGWNRLRLEVTGNTVTGYFGGTFGSTTTGTKISGSLSAPAEGGVYVSFREGISDNTKARPFTMDNLVYTPTAFTGAVDTTEGTAKASTVDTPRVGTNGCPQVGNAGFAVTAGGLVSSGTSFLAIGRKSASPFDFSRAGGQKCSFLYVDPSVIVNMTADADGEWSLALPIPNNAALKGTEGYLQVLDVDPALPVNTKIANTRILRLKMG